MDRANIDALPPNISELIYKFVRLSKGGHALSKNLHPINQPQTGSTIRIRNLSKNGNAGRKFDFNANILSTKKLAVLGRNKSNFTRSQNVFNIYGKKINNNQIPNDEKNLFLLKRKSSMPGKNRQWCLQMGKDEVPVFLSHPKADMASNYMGN